MDKIELKNTDIEELLKWRDEHKELVRNHPAPLKGVDIVCVDSGYTIKGIRDGDYLRLYLSINGRGLGHSEFRHRSDGMWALIKNKMQVTAEDLQSVLTVYCSIMALMASGPIIQSDREPKPTKPNKQSKQYTSKPRPRTTYIIRKTRGTICAVSRGSHASPHGIFTVRGHFRHYKDGRVIWISEYKKGTGNKKRKTYKMGIFEE